MRAGHHFMGVLMLGGKVRQLIRANRRSAPARGVARICEKYLRAWHNDGFYEFAQNGEQFAIQRFAQWAGNRPITVWDVGAHRGGWADQAHAVIPDASIVSFEILPPIAELLVERHRGADWLTIHNLGLSDTVGTVEVTWNKSHDTTNAIAPRLDNKWFSNKEVEILSCQVSTIDRLIAEGMAPPELLKIDVEGHDALVLEGAKGLLGSARAPQMIQFEYGDTWIPAGRLLHQTSAMLTSLGYSLGRLYPRHVEFGAYDYRDETFRMGNMIAVKNPELLALLDGHGK